MELTPIGFDEIVVGWSDVDPATGNGGWQSKIMHRSPSPETARRLRAWVGSASPTGPFLREVPVLDVCLEPDPIVPTDRPER